MGRLEAQERAPGSDATNTVLMTQVIGNKADAQQQTVGTTRSLMGYIKGILTKLGTGKASAQVSATTIDLNQVAASYDLFTGTTQAFILESLVIRLPNVDVSDDANITSISIQTDDVTATVLINTTEGAKANLTAEAQLAWIGMAYITVDTKIQLTIAGGAADAATVCNVVATGRAVVDGGTLA